MNLVRLPFFCVMLALASCSGSRGLTYLEHALLAPPLLPADFSQMSIECGLEQQSADPLYRTASQVDYDLPEWEQRIAADWRFFDATTSEGLLTVIDFRRVGGDLAYRYLGNDNSHDQLYEPWSSSKVHAFTVAVSALRQHGIGADASVGDVALGDLITSVHSYAPAGNADGDSNAIATYFLNMAGRDYATDLFHSAWLKLANPDIRFRGAYGPSAFAPSSHEFVAGNDNARYTPDLYTTATDDPGYRSYRCDQCGTDGNKAMTALAQTEWLKRLASHSRVAATRHPHLETSDVETLFFGRPAAAHTLDGKNVGGMLAGISVFLQEALANALAPDVEEDAKTTLDSLTNGRWRVYQKIGFGPSETRDTSEVVMLAHVCLPNVGGSGREFTLLARAALPGAAPDESGVGLAGIKLRQLLDRSLPKLLGIPN